METINSNVTWLTEWLHSRLQLLNLSEFWTEVLLFGVSAVIMLLASWLAFMIVRRVLVFTIVKMVRKTRSKIDDFLVHRKVFHRLAHLAPVVVIYFLSDLFWGAQTTRLAVFHDIVSLYLLVVIIMVFQAFLKAFEDIYNTFPFAYDRPIKGYLQVIQLLAIIIGLLIAVSIIFDVKVTAIIAGMGALAAVLMLVFRDSILGLSPVCNCQPTVWSG